MRDALNCFLPIVEDDMNGANLNAGTRGVNTSITSNGYYGFQPLPDKKPSEENHFEQMETQTCDMDIQFNNMIEVEPASPQQHIREHTNRKRAWEYGADFTNLKRRRENEPISIIPLQPTSKCLNLRQPTHNVPDMPRCIMGHYI